MDISFVNQLDAGRFVFKWVKYAGITPSDCQQTLLVHAELEFKWIPKTRKQINADPLTNSELRLVSDPQVVKPRSTEPEDLGSKPRTNRAFFFLFVFL